MNEPSGIDPDRPETWPASARQYLARHRPPVSDSGLRDAVREEIRRSGPISFARFMERALYDPERGYYATAAGRIGAAGDFVTGPTIHLAFGTLLFRRIRRVWEQLGHPEPFVLAEAGPGTGALAAQILGAGVQEDLRGAREDRTPDLKIHYRLIEPFPAWREVQQRRLAPWAGSVEWFAELEDQPDSPHLVLANELLDALPVHRVVRRQDELRELYVGLDERGSLAEVEGPLSTVDLATYFDRLGLEPPPGIPVEVNLAAPAWLRRAMAATTPTLCAGTRGWIWLLDYGAEAAELYSAPRGGTLRGFHQHTLSMDPFDRVGAQDLTADVDFTTLIQAAAEDGWVVEEFTTQRELLLSLGLEEFLRPDPVSPDGRDSDRPTPGRWALLQLIDPRGLGALRSLLLRHGGACSRQGEGSLPSGAV